MAIRKMVAYQDQWKRLQVTLDRFSDGPATGTRDGIFDATRVTAWLMRTGSATVEADGLRRRARPGQWLICLPGRRRQQIDRNARYVSIHFLVESPDNVAQWSGPRVVVLSSTRELNRALSCVQRTALIRRMVDAGLIHPEQVEATLPDKLQFQSTSAAFFCELFLALITRQVEFKPPSIHDSRVRHCLEILRRDDFQDLFSRHKLAAQYGLSASQLDRLWRAEVGMTPQAYRDQCRIEKACSLLETAECTIKEIAYQTGFRRLSRFSIWFRSKRGMSPRNFRQRQLDRE